MLQRYLIKQKNERHYLQIIHPIRGLYPEYVKNAYNLTRRQVTQLRNGLRLWRVSFASAMQEAWVRSLGRSPGKGKGYPLQYPGLENSMDRIESQRESHGLYSVTKSQTWLSDFHFLSSLYPFVDAHFSRFVVSLWVYIDWLLLCVWVFNVYT